MTNKITLPDGTIIIDEAPTDLLYYGRSMESWEPVVEEAPNDPGISYVRKNHDWAALDPAQAGLTVTEIVPAIAKVGLAGNLTASVYGAGFTNTTVVLWSGNPLTTAFVSANEVTVTIDPSMAVAPQVDTITVEDGGVPGTGAAGFHFVAPGTGADAGLGLSMDKTTTPNPTINLQPAGDGPPTLGGVYVVDRVRNVSEGLELGIDGRLRAPLATPRLAGTIVEPEDDGKGYVRTTLNGVSQWAPPAGQPATDFGAGLSLDETATPWIVHLQQATDFSLGGIFEPVQDGMAYSRQFDAVGQVWKWVPALTAGLQITSIIPDASTFGTGMPLLDVHAYGSEFTPTCVIHVDDNPAQTTYVSPTELIFKLNPAVPIAESFHIITVHDPAAVPPALVDGLGAEQFNFIISSTAVDYGIGLALNAGAPGDNPVVDLTPAGWDAKFLGGVYTTGGRSATEGLDLAAAGTGQISAPLATPALAGTIVEPPADSQKYVRTTNEFTGLSSWDHASAHMDYVIGLHEWFDAAGERLNRVDLKPASASEIGGIKEPPMSPIGANYVRSSEGEWVLQPEAGKPLEFRVGIDEVNGVVDLQPANKNGEIGGVKVVGRGPTQGLELATDGTIWAPLATDKLAGSLTEPPPDDKSYARKRTLVGNSTWVEVDDSSGIGDVEKEPVGEEYVRAYGRWLPIQKGGQVQPRKVNVGGDTMTGLLVLSGDPIDELGAVPRRMLADLKQYVDVQDTADRLWVETNYTDKPPPGGPFWMLDGAWSNIPASVNVTYGIGINLDGDVVNLQPATGGQSGVTPEIGGVYGTARSERNGIVIDPQGHISAPLADELLAGTIIEPPRDGKQYARITPLTGPAEWVETSATGVTISDTPPVAPAHGDLWWESDSGTMFIWYDDGTSAQWVQTDASPEMPSYGIGIDLEGGAVNLKPANWNGQIGGVRTIGRGPTNGLEFSVNGSLLSVPLCTDVLAGSIVDAPRDGQPYLRRDGSWEVSAMAVGAIISSDSPPANPTQDLLWFNTTNGCTYIWNVDVDSSQWVMQSSPSAGGGAAGITEAPVDGTPYSRQDATWVASTSAAANYGDLKHGFQAADHAGWVKLDGRAVTTLTATQQTQAAALGFTTNIPLGDGVVFMQGSGALGAVTGSMSKTIAQGNLPNITLNSNNTGAHTHPVPAAGLTVSSAGAHKHTITGNSGGTPTDLWNIDQNSVTPWAGDVDNFMNAGYQYQASKSIIDSGGAHTHPLAGTATASSSGAHAHTVPLGGGGTPLDVTPKSISATAFVYLGI